MVMNLVFDIGYNVGNFAHDIIQSYPHCKVIGVDANGSLLSNAPANVTFVNVLMSNIDNELRPFYIETLQSGISTASREFMYDSRFGKGNRVVDASFNCWDKVDIVKTMTLDTLVKRFGRPDLIKIDVEGWEHKVLLGLTSKQSRICFEWSEEIFHVTEQCVRHLIRLGYREFCVAGYFEEGDVFSKLEYDVNGDTYDRQPVKFHRWFDLQQDIKRMLHPDRRMNMGMVFVR